MTVVTERRCDRYGCGKLVEPRTPSITYNTPQYPDSRVDLCGDCHTLLLSFLGKHPVHKHALDPGLWRALDHPNMPCGCHHRIDCETRRRD